MERVIRVLVHYYARRRARARARRTSARRASCARTCSPRSSAWRPGAMTVTFADKLARIPGYDAGSPAGQGARVGGRRRRSQARLERVAFGAAPGGRRGDRARGRARPTAIPTEPRSCCGAGSPSATTPTRPRSPSPTARARSCSPPREALVRARRRDRLRAGRRSRCTRTWRRSRARARSASRSARADVHDLDAIADRDHGGDPARADLQPEQPDRRPTSRRSGSASSCERVPDHVTVILDEAYIEFQAADDPEATLDLRDELPEPGLPAHLLASATGSPGCGSATRSARPKFRAAVDAVRQPFSVNALAQAAAAEAILPPGRRRCAASSARSSSGSGSRRACASSASRRPTAGQLLLGRARRPRRGRDRRSARPSGRASSAPATPLGGPGHIRVTYGHARARTSGSSRRSRGCCRRLADGREPTRWRAARRRPSRSLAAEALGLAGPRPRR